MKKRLVILGLVLNFVLLSSLAYAFEYVTCHNSSDCMTYEPTNLQPAKGQSYQDPDMHTTITRITDTQNVSGTTDAFIQYSRYTPVSSDGKYLITAQKRLYNLTNFSYMGRAPHVRGTDPFGGENCGGDMEYRWDYTGNHPTRVYYRYGTKFYQADILTGNPGVSELIRDFKDDFPEIPQLCIIHNDDEGDSSRDSRYWVFMAQGAYNSTLGRRPLYYIFTYDKDYDLYNPDDDEKPGKIIKVLDRNLMESWGGISFSGLIENEIHKPNFVDISPSGNKVAASWLWHSGGAGSPIDGPRVYNLDFTNPVKVGGDSKHSGWGYDYNGNEVFVQPWTGDYMTMTNVNTGETNQIIYHTDFGGWDVNFHFSRLYNKKGWILMSFYDQDYNQWADNQIIMLELKDKSENPRIWRISHAMNNRVPTRSVSPRASLDIQGNRIFWGANWNGGDITEVYMADLPPTWWEDLGGVTVLLGDVDGNGKVDIKDLILVAKDFGKTVGFNPGCDLNKDGRVDIKDLIIVAKNFGRRQ